MERRLSMWVGLELSKSYRPGMRQASHCPAFKSPHRCFKAILDNIGARRQRRLLQAQSLTPSRLAKADVKDRSALRVI
ncbi:hypothetical protein [Novosphingobium sp.]|uniref:hypothetical protein n=1 Tax=Novosphingobium sp. TaxID=1874826 RepID=UPI001D6CA6B3|nr:hypothetical protein [Novosphingobium sp.]MBX9664738.1 hypothetical protein [Novosphingobium sp.]